MSMTVTDVIHARQADRATDRIGRLGEFWATRYQHGWSVFGYRSGLIDEGLTRDQAEHRLALFEDTRTKESA